MTWSLCTNSEAVTSELEYVQQLDPDNFLKYLHASDIKFPSDIAHSHHGLSIDDFCSQANDITQTIKVRREHHLLCIYLFLMTHDFSLDFPNGDLLVFKDTGNKTPNRHVTGTKCRPNITAAFEKDWIMDDYTDWALIRLTGERASEGKSREIQRKNVATLMRRRRGSMREYVQRDDLEPRARCGGAPARQAGGAATRAAQPPQPHNPSNSQHTATAHPRQLLGSAPNSVEISSIGGTMDPQRIGALRSLDPRQSLNTFISGYKAPTARAGIPASNKHYPQQGLVQASPPYKLERCPTSCTASPGPRAKYRDWVTTADRPIRVP